MPRLARDGVYKPNRLFGRHSDKGSVENDTDNEADIIHEADKEPTPGLQARLAALPGRHLTTSHSPAIVADQGQWRQ